MLYMYMYMFQFQLHKNDESGCACDVMKHLEASQICHVTSIHHNPSLFVCVSV